MFSLFLLEIFWDGIGIRFWFSGVRIEGDIGGFGGGFIKGWGMLLVYIYVKRMKVKGIYN